MILDTDQLIQLNFIGIEAAKKAAMLIKGYAGKELKVDKKEGGTSLASQVVTEVDRKAQEVILNTLQPTIDEYDLGLLTEESEDNGSRFTKDYFWCIDPLDGTLSFTEGKEGYAVSIALVSKEGIPQIGIVADVVNQKAYVAVKGAGVYKTGSSITLSGFKRSETTFTVFTGRDFEKHPYYAATRDFFIRQVDMRNLKELAFADTGGAVMQTCWVLENMPACYFKFPRKSKGGGCVWDYAATSCIYNELGGIVSDIYGAPLDLNPRESVFMNEKGVIYCTDKTVQDSVIGLYKELKEQ